MKASKAAIGPAGALQRDAQPASVRGEAALPLPTTTSSKDLAKDWAAEMMAASKTVDSLIACLPSVETTEEEQLQGIARLMAENDMVGEELREEVKLTEQQLEEVRAIYAVLADAELEKRTLQKTESASMMTRKL